MQNSSASNSISTTNSQLRGVINHKIDSINPLALEYVDNAKTLLYATGALDNRSAKLSLLTNISSYERFDESEETSKINVSSWYSPLVTPSGLLTDDYNSFDFILLSLLTIRINIL
jgi:hypothetical protein